MEANLPFFLETPFPLSEEVNKILDEAYHTALAKRNEFITPEHVLFLLLQQDKFLEALMAIDVDIDALNNAISDYLISLDEVPEQNECDPEPSIQFMQMMSITILAAGNSGRSTISVPHIVKAILSIPESNAQQYLSESIRGEEGFFISQLITNYDMLNDFNNAINNPGAKDEKPKGNNEWRNHVSCINDLIDKKNPLIGREDELEKTIRILCRKDKNNPLHIGEPGVGKTALIYGLARKIEKGEVPEKLKNSKIYQLDIGTLLAGTQYRGDFEKRIKTIMEGISNEPNPIIYIDEIHNLVGAGAIGESSMDASNMLKPYLESGEIRFIGSTTYEEYKKHFAKSKGIVRRFSNIDIEEPSIEETIKILNALKSNYENFHQVIYADEALESAVRGSKKYINERFLPDKAIDVIDEAGAFRHIHPEENNLVDKSLIEDIISKISKADISEVKESGRHQLSSLEERMSGKIFGQEKAVLEVAEAVQLSKAGLTDEDKPIASLLFVGPTGVGKTEVAKVLSEELGINLIRFDMSEYAEKHTVAKLIGSPAGYIGYEDGGLLTDAIRKTPNCVLLLDEIEKAHSDIYNILLQVMDYAKLSDNKGNKADFRNVILIMTSNAGAQFASQSKVGFGNNTTSGDAMMKQIKKTFKPEFLNRLSATVTFNDMTEEMAKQILHKKLGYLQRKLDLKKIQMKLEDKAFNFLLEKGMTKEYGARELDRAINTYLKPLLMREILYGKLKEGGLAEINLVNDKLVMA